MLDPTNIKTWPMAERESLVSVKDVMSLDNVPPWQHLPAYYYQQLRTIADQIKKAKEENAAIIWFIGGHVVKRGVQRFIIDLMERGFITHLAGNGAVALHDWELARFGHTSEPVPKYLPDGKFGMWTEIKEFNWLIGWGGRGFGNSLALASDINLAFNAKVCKVPFTIHVGIGQDVFCQHPSYNSLSHGLASYVDFLKFVESVRNLQNGVFLNFGSQVFGPEVFLKALSMARNLAIQEGKEINKFTTGVFDILPMPSGDNEQYFNRAWKTIIKRATADGGQGFYVQGDHRVTIPNLWKLLVGGK